MPLIGGLILLIQFSFVFHALRSGRPYWWIFIIMGFPVMGCLIYYFVEVFPQSREHRHVHKTARKLVKALQPDADLKRRAEEVEVCGSIDNKMALAKECVEHQMHAEAISLYESCLHGPFANDGNLLFNLAQAAIDGSFWDKAETTISRLKIDNSSLRPLEVRLLEARLLEGRKNTDGALAIYRELIPEFVGMEARYRYGELLSRLGQHEAANHVFDEILKLAKRKGPSIDEEREWVAAAKRAIVKS